MTIKGFSEDFTVCDRCGKSELKGTWTIETSEGDIYRLGSSCIHKRFQMEASEVKNMIATFKKEEKNALAFKAFYELHIVPLKNDFVARINSTFTTEYVNLPDWAKKQYHQIESDYNRVIEYRMKKAKI